MFPYRANATLYVPAGTKEVYETAAVWKGFGNIVEMEPSPFIAFTDAKVKALCVANWDTNHDGKLSKDEAAAVTDLGQVFSNKKEITSFKELQYFMGLTSIENRAFDGCSSLTSVTIPNSVTSIGEYAFQGCSSLTSITIPESVTSIGERAFSGCGSLISITIPSSVTSIENRAFDGCSSLTSVTIPNSVTSIGEYAFQGCSSLTSITIPESVTSIGERAFSGCGSLISITIPSSVTSIGENAFQGCTGLPIIDNLRYADTYLVEAVDKNQSSYAIRLGTRFIGPSAFYYCSGLTSVTIPSSVTSIGNYAFYGCSGLTSIGIPPNVTSIGNSAFFGCSGLTSITIPSSVTSIGDQAFLGCSNLASVTIPSSVTSIGNYAFQHTTGLPVIDNLRYADTYLIGAVDNNQSSYAILSETRFIGAGAFWCCSDLTSITIPSSVTSIGSDAFLGCSGLTSIDFPESVTSIGSSAFQGCSSLTSITIPSSVTSIGSGAFQGCSGLTSVTVEWEEPLEVSWNDIFYGVPLDQATLYVPIGTKEAYEAADVWKDFGNIVENASSPIITFTDAKVKALCVENWDTNHDGELSMAEAAAVTDIGQVFKENKEITSFDELQYFTGLTSIGDNAFYGCSTLTSITIPSSVTSIGEGAFYDCYNLTSITIPSSVTSIGGYAFQRCPSLPIIDNLRYADTFLVEAVDMGQSSCTIQPGTRFIGAEAFFWCSSLTSIDIPSSVTSIGSSAFAVCSGLTSITIPSSVTSIGAGAFSSCSGLTSITIHSGVKSIGHMAFSECSSLTSVTIPSSVTSIEDWAFARCSGLISVISSGVKSIGLGAFSECSSLTSVTIPSSVTSIGSQTFEMCSSLTSVTVEWEKPLKVSWSDWIFDEVPLSQATLYVPIGTKEAYEAAAVWKDFGNIVEKAPVLNKLLVAPVTIHTGKTATLSISLDNEDDLIAFEFFMTLPEGVSIAEDGDGYLDAVLNSTRSNRHSLEVDLGTDGAYHFLCYSNSNNALKGNSGELLSITLCCEDGMEPGAYEGLLSTIKFSDINETPVVLPNHNFSIEVTDVTMGDVNDDGFIDVMDIVSMVNKIMDHPSASFVFAAADHNGDNLIDVMDLVAEVRIVMSQTANAPSGSFNQLSGALSLQTSTDGTVSLSLGDAEHYVASQFVVTLSPGQSLSDVTTDSRHTVSFERIADNQYAVVSYSPGNDPYASNATALTLHVEGAGEVSVENAAFVSSAMEMVLFQGVGSGYTDGIRGLTYDFSTPADIYSPSGILLRKDATSADGLKSGVYIINGNKYIKK